MSALRPETAEQPEAAEGGGSDVVGYLCEFLSDSELRAQDLSENRL